MVKLYGTCGLVFLEMWSRFSGHPVPEMCTSFFFKEVVSFLGYRSSSFDKMW